MRRLFVWILLVALFGLSSVIAQNPSKKAPSSFAPVNIEEPFQSIFQRMSAAKAGIMKKHMDLLNARYDLANRASKDVAMTRGKSIQIGVRVKLSSGTTWEKLASLTPEQVRDQNL